MFKNNLAMRLSIILLFLIGLPLAAKAQEKPNDGYSTYYRGVKSYDLFTDLPTRDSNRFNDASNSFFSDTDGCPDEISIGSIDEDSGITGSANINVNIDGNITVVCGGL